MGNKRAIGNGHFGVNEKTKISISEHKGLNYRQQLRRTIGREKQLFIVEGSEGCVI